jgi:diguanylate cyclase (GGDEF)-like protein
MLVGILFIAGALPWPNFNPAVSSLSVSAVLCAVALLRYRLLDLTPLARETVIEQLADALIVTDARGLISDFNPAASGVLPELTREALGRPLNAVLAGRSELIHALQAACEIGRSRAGVDRGEGGTAGCDRRRSVSLALHGAGSDDGPDLRHFSLRITPVVRRTGLHIGDSIVLHDVTDTVRLYEQARRMANTDELTGLLSRRRLLELGLQEVARARRHGRSLCVLLMDLDHFKLVNDLHGHAAGDAVLRALGTRCRVELREFDLVGRYGGDEFCAVLPELKAVAARDVAERLRSAISGLAVQHGETLIRPTVSIGVAHAQVDDETTLDGLMRAADEALYVAKNAGRDRVAPPHAEWACEGPAPRPVRARGPWRGVSGASWDGGGLAGRCDEVRDRA